MSNIFDQFDTTGQEVKPAPKIKPEVNPYDQFKPIGQPSNNIPDQQLPRGVQPEKGMFDMTPTMETMATVGSSIAAEPASGIAGLLSAISSDRSLEKSVDAINSTREAMTYQPRTSEAQENLQSIGNLLQPVAEGMEWAETELGQATLKATGSPELATIAHTLPTAVLETLGVLSFAPRAVQRSADNINQQNYINSVDSPAPYLKPIPQEFMPDVQGTELPLNEQKNISNMFASEGISPAGRSRIAGDVRSQQQEGWLLRQTDDVAADEFRDRVYLENEQVKGRFRQVAEYLGLPEEAGDTLKTSLDGIKSSLAGERRLAYKDLASLVSDNPDLVSQFPVPKESVLSSVKRASEYGLEQGKRNELSRLLKRYGLSDEIIEPDALAKILGDDAVTDLNIGTLEDFRKEVNKMLPADSADGVIRGARREIITATDNILDDFASLADDGDLPIEIRDQAKKARALRRKEAEIFEAKDLVQQLVGDKPGTITPLVDASEVVTKIRNTKKIGEFNKMIGLLENGGAGSKQALDNLQSVVVVDLLNGATKAKSSVMGAERASIFSGTNYSNAIDKFGRLKLKRLFKNKPEIYRILSTQEKINKRRVTGVEATQKGSIPPALVNLLYRGASQVPVLKKITPDPVKNASKKALKQAKNLKPSKPMFDDYITINAPRLAASLGLGSAPQVSEQIGENY